MVKNSRIPAEVGFNLIKILTHPRTESLFPGDPLPGIHSFSDSCLVVSQPRIALSAQHAANVSRDVVMVAHKLFLGIAADQTGAFLSPTLGANYH